MTEPKETNMTELSPQAETTLPLDQAALPLDQVYSQEYRAQQFLEYIRRVMWVLWLLLPLELFLTLWRGNTQLIVGAVMVVLLALATLVARWVARTGRVNQGVYILAGTLVTIVTPAGLYMTNMLPTAFMVYIVAITLINMLVSPRSARRFVIVTAPLAAVAVALDAWAPLSPQPLPFALNLSITLATFIAASYLVYLFGRNLWRALLSAQRYASQLEASRADLIARSQELEATTRELFARSAELQETNRQLEDLTRQTRHRATLLEAGVEVSRAAVQIRDLDQLLPQITRLISEHFGFYHVGIFLVDKPSGYAVLRAANSPGGRRMLARGHKLRVGSEGIVGYVTSTGQPRIALDVGQDAVYFNNPDLPATRSEMALPLRLGDEIIGALDVQSTQEAAFDQEDIAVLSGLADQIALIIQNAILFQQARTALQESEQIYRRYLRQEWEGFMRRQPIRRPSRQPAGPEVER